VTVTKLTSLLGATLKYSEKTLCIHLAPRLEELCSEIFIYDTRLIQQKNGVFEIADPSHEILI